LRGFSEAVDNAIEICLVEKFSDTDCTDFHGSGFNQCESVKVFADGHHFLTTKAPRHKANRCGGEPMAHSQYDR
jgi:hypothetical protein